jgi:hypothetical protein
VHDQYVGLLRAGVDPAKRADLLVRGTADTYLCLWTKAPLGVESDGLLECVRDRDAGVAGREQ